MCSREHRLQVTLRALDRRAVGESPAVGQPVDVRVDRERRDAEAAAHDDRRRLVADAGERFEEVPVADHLAAGVDDLIRHQPQVLGLGRRESDRPDVGEDLIGIERRHLLGRVGHGEQPGRHLVDLLVGRLSRQRNRNEQRVRVRVVERHRRVGIQLVEDLSDPISLVLATHAANLARTGLRASDRWPGYGWFTARDNTVTMRTPRHLVTALALLTAGTVVGVAAQQSVSADVSSGDRPVLIQITACRLADTRPAPDNVGPRIGKLGPGETVTFDAQDASTKCAGKIPTDAVGLSMNVTALNATSKSFFTIWPSGPLPLASSLNPAPGEPPTPNGVATPIEGGKFNVYNNRGNSDILIDINGYYVNHDHDDVYLSEAEIDAKIAASGGGSTAGTFSVGAAAFDAWESQFGWAKDLAPSIGGGGAWITQSTRRRLHSGPCCSDPTPGRCDHHRSDGVLHGHLGHLRPRVAAALRGVRRRRQGRCVRRVHRVAGERRGRSGDHPAERNGRQLGLQLLLHRRIGLMGQRTG